MNQERDFKYRDIMIAFHNPIHPDNKTTIYTCNHCDEESVFPNTTINVAYRRSAPIRCRKCPTVPAGFRRSNQPQHIICNDCDIQYHFPKNTYYFKCYCQLTSKADERILYEELSRIDGCTLSREEKVQCIPGTTHKVDIKCTMKDGTTYFIEVDGGSHFSQKQAQLDLTFQRLFEEHCQNQPYYLIRITTRQVTNQHSLAHFIENLKNGQYMGQKVNTAI